MRIEAFVPLIDFIVKTILYYIALKVRKLDARLMTCILCGGASILTGLIPFPEMLHVVLTIVIAGFFIVRDTDTEIYPNGIFIPLAAEVADAFLLNYAVMPLIGML
jgi:hypothetical protein